MKNRIVPAGILIFYSAVLIKILVLKDLPVIRIGVLMFNFGGTRDGAPNFWPFKTILPYLLGEKGWLIAAINLVGNIILLVPIGVLVPLIFRGTTWKKMCWLAVGTGLAIECMQAMLHMGIFDVDDIILNATGTLIGYRVYTLLANMRRRSTTAVIIGCVAMVVAIGTLAVVYKIDLLQEDVLPEPRQQEVADSTAGKRHHETTGTVRYKDPCGATGGTGQIISVGSNSITVMQNNNTSVVISLTARTTIRNAAGAISITDLQVGDRVTLVVDLHGNGTGTATTVLVCNNVIPQPARQ